MYGIIPRIQNVVGKNSGWVGFDDFFNDFFNDSLNPVTSGNIRADIKEKENEYVIEAELPGVEKENINLELEKNVLTIGIEQKQEENEEKENYIRKERRYGRYKRSFYIENIEEDQIKAEYKNGILQVVLPKLKKEEKKSKIEIN